MVTCIAQLQGHPRWLSEEEFCLCWLDKVSCSYRFDEFKEREFAITSLGRISFIRDGKEPDPHSGPSGRWMMGGKLSASDHVASLEDMHVQGTTVTMKLKGRAFVLNLRSDEEVKAVTTALNSTSLLLFCGPPPYKTSGVALKVRPLYVA